MKKSELKSLVESLSKKDRDWLDSQVKSEVIYKIISGNEPIFSSNKNTSKTTCINTALGLSKEIELEFSVHVRKLILEATLDE
jgi:DNA phosphorothioation-dependent restriction protein DptG